MDKSRRFFALLIVVGLLLGGCMAEGNNADNALEINETAAVPTLPEKLLPMPVHLRCRIRQALPRTEVLHTISSYSFFLR